MDIELCTHPCLLQICIPSPTSVTLSGPTVRVATSMHYVDTTGDDCGAHQFLSPTTLVPGFHLACLQPEESTGDISVTLFMDGQATGNQTLTLPTLEASETALHVRSNYETQRRQFQYTPPPAPPPALVHSRRK